MSKRKINFALGEYFHIYNRGNSKQEIYCDKYDYERFIKLLYISNSSINFNLKDLIEDIFSVDREGELVSIGAYCLMPNHFHILITPKIENGVSIFMQKLATAYSMYFNSKYARTGSLFEGKFKAEHVDNDRYLKYLFSYIHLNPLKLIDKTWKDKGVKNKKQALDYFGNYKFSSYLDYLSDDRQEIKILDKKEFPKYFPDEVSFKEEIFDWLSYNDLNP